MREIKMVGISSSPRHGNTEIMVKEALTAAKKLGFAVKTELISLAGKVIKPCTDCKACVKLNEYCPKDDDWFDVIKHLVEEVPNGLVIGSPVYFFSVNSILRAFFERCTCLFKKAWHEEFPHPPPDWHRTAAGALTVGFHRHGGEEHALSTIHHWFLSNGFVCVGGGTGDYLGGGGWQQHVDSLDSVKGDEIGLKSARNVGKRVAYTAKLLAEGALSLPKTPQVMNKLN